MESPDQIDLVGDPTLNDEFKTSEHNSFHEEPIDVHADDPNILKGTPSTVDPLSMAGSTAVPQEAGEVLPELRRDP